MTRPPFPLPARLTLFAAVLLAAGAPRPARADRRAYAETYEAVTAAPKALDVEIWHTYATDAEINNGPPAKGNRTMLELEYGITPRWDVALYTMVDAGTEDDGYAGFKIETRFRLAAPEALFIDPVLYLEYQHLSKGDATDKAEIKLILGKNIERWNVALNLAAEVEREKEMDETELKPEAEFAFGVSREIGSPAFKLGAEVFGLVEKEEKPGEGEEIEPYVFAGPALSWATGFKSAMSGLWLTVGAGRGIVESDAYYVRAILGLQF